MGLRRGRRSGPAADPRGGLGPPLVGSRPGAPRRTGGSPPTAPAQSPPPTGRAARSVRAVTIPAMSSRSNPARSMRRAPAVRLISVKIFRNGWRRWSSSLRKVSTSKRRPRAVRDSVAAKSWVERSAQCMSSSTISTGPAAAASSTATVRSSNTRNASGLRGASGSRRVSIRRADGRDPRSSTPLRRDRTASTTGANDIPASMSRPCPVATANPRSPARRSRSATSVVFPIPASPPTSTTCGLPCAARPSASSNSAMSCSRPSSRAPDPLGIDMESTALGVDAAEAPRPAIVGATQRTGDRDPAAGTHPGHPRLGACDSPGLVVFPMWGPVLRASVRVLRVA